ncbi:hypothetical protein EYF80_052345 [Liparis tanakae]|uniref:Uncharacterized protein n=1 Tax=Liparis tanakae TaxID=230148 RepID=A0A4Z2F9L7_9TELE|nr:hypothetical protein EYF80_052345 [Liparis tanakae]
MNSKEGGRRRSRIRSGLRCSRARGSRAPRSSPPRSSPPRSPRSTDVGTEPRNCPWRRESGAAEEREEASVRLRTGLDMSGAKERKEEEGSGARCEIEKRKRKEEGDERQNGERQEERREERKRQEPMKEDGWRVMNVVVIIIGERVGEERAITPPGPCGWKAVALARHSAASSGEPWRKHCLKTAPPPPRVTRHSYSALRSSQ